MTETATTETIKTPPRRKYKRRAHAAKPATEKKADSFAGLTATTCCDACTPDRCVISTVGICKHPGKTSDSGCGPITMKNRQKAKLILKRQAIEAQG